MCFYRGSKKQSIFKTRFEAMQLSIIYLNYYTY